MSSVSDLKLEDLPGVEPHLISKLKRAGIQSVLDLAVSIPHELVLGGGDYNERNGIAADIETISDLVMRAKKALMDSGILSKEFCTAEEVMERRKSLVRFTTGSANLDTFLKGGVETQAITEIAGEFGSGKSQICHTLCVTANLGKGKGKGKGLDSIIFIDTENTFRPERVHQIAEARGLDSEEIMKRVFVCKINNSAQHYINAQNVLKTIGSPGSGYGQLNDPRGVYGDTKGNLYVVDSGNNRIQVFDSNGKFIRAWGSYGSGDGQFYNPGRVAVDPSGNVFVADFGNNRVEKFDGNGNFITAWGSYGQGD
jgi:hypothetical protein